MSTAKQIEVIERNKSALTDPELLRAFNNYPDLFTGTAKTVLTLNQMIDKGVIDAKHLYSGNGAELAAKRLDRSANYIRQWLTKLKAWRATDV